MRAYLRAQDRLNRRVGYGDGDENDSERRDFQDLNRDLASPDVRRLPATVAPPHRQPPAAQRKQTLGVLRSSKRHDGRTKGRELARHISGLRPPRLYEGVERDRDERGHRNVGRTLVP